MLKINKSVLKVIGITLAGILLCATILMLTGCNQQVVDLTYKYNKAIISLPNGTCIEGEVQSWRDYENSDQIQIKIDGTTYLVHSVNCCLIAE